ncbi:MAG: hypothetical protein ACK4FF_11280 [Limnobacter sp.]|uniref:hypothetical protein n=1 Tax=Limnobacter sp. TaxID=2003368 RepID=UPI00391D1F72
MRLLSQHRWVLLSILCALGIAAPLAFRTSTSAPSVDTRLLAYDLACATTGRAPQVVLLDKPTTLTTDWTLIDLPSSVHRVPAIEDFYVYGSHTAHDTSEDLKDNAPSDLEIPSGFQIKASGNVVYLSMKAMDEQGREVRLTQNGWLYSNHTNPPSPAAGFGLENRRWNKFFFGPDVKLRQIAVKASAPITIERVTWSPMDYCKWPGRTWDTIPEEKRYNFEGPSPATGEWGPIPPPPVITFEPVKPTKE